MSTVSAKSSWSTSERVVLAALAMITAHVAFRAWAVAGSWFYEDDFIFLGTTAAGQDDGAWLLEPHNIHFMPFARWLTTLVGHAGAFSWGAAVTQIVVLQALVAIACWWMLRTAFGDRPGILIPLGLFLVSPATITSDVWWAAAINQLPHQIAIFAAVAAHLTYLRSRRPSHAVLTGAFTVLGYASYTKSLLIPVLLVAITFLYFARGSFVRRWRETFGAYWHAWAIQFGLLASYVIVYLTVVPRSPTPEPQVLFDTLDLSLVTTAVPSLAGGPWMWQTLGPPGGVGPRLFADPPLMLTVLAWGLVVGLVLLQSLRHRWAWPPVALVLGYAAASSVLIAAGRSTAFGTAPAALELRYFADLAGIGALGLGLLLMPILGARQSLTPREPAVLSLRIPRRWPAALLAVVVVGSVLSSVRYVQPWHDETQMPQRAFIATVGEQRTTEPQPLIDVWVPDTVLWGVAFPANLTSQIFATYHRDFDYVSSGTDLNMIGPTGTIVPARVEGDPRNPPGPEPDCGYRITDEAVEIPVEPVIAFPFWMSVGYVSGGDGTIVVTAGATRQELAVESGLHTAFLQTASEYDTVRIRPVGDVNLCVDAIRVGAVFPRDGAL